MAYRLGKTGKQVFHHTWENECTQHWLNFRLVTVYIKILYRYIYIFLKQCSYLEVLTCVVKVFAWNWGLSTVGVTALLGPRLASQHLFVHRLHESCKVPSQLSAIMVTFQIYPSNLQWFRAFDVFRAIHDQLIDSMQMQLRLQSDQLLAVSPSAAAALD